MQVSLREVKKHSFPAGKFLRGSFVSAVRIGTDLPGRLIPHLLPAGRPPYFLCRACMHPRYASRPHLSPALVASAFVTDVPRICCDQLCLTCALSAEGADTVPENSLFSGFFVCSVYLYSFPLSYMSPCKCIVGRITGERSARSRYRRRFAREKGTPSCSLPRTAVFFVCQS